MRGRRADVRGWALRSEADSNVSATRQLLRSGALGLHGDEVSLESVELLVGLLEGGSLHRRPD